MKLETKEYKSSHGKIYSTILPLNGNENIDAIGEIWDVGLAKEIVRRFNQQEESGAIQREPASNSEVIMAMLKYGGGFVFNLAKAAQVADPDNIERIKSAWPEYWAEYSEMALLNRRQQQNG